MIGLEIGGGCTGRWADMLGGMVGAAGRKANRNCGATSTMASKDKKRKQGAAGAYI